MPIFGVAVLYRMLYLQYGNYKTNLVNKLCVQNFECAVHIVHLADYGKNEKKHLKRWSPYSTGD